MNADQRLRKTLEYSCSACNGTDHRTTSCTAELDKRGQEILDYHKQCKAEGPGVVEDPMDALGGIIALFLILAFLVMAFGA